MDYKKHIDAPDIRKALKGALIWLRLIKLTTSKGSAIDIADGGHYDILKYIVETEADVNVQDCEGKTALSLAADSGHLNIIKFLIDKKADINHVDQSGWCPLFFASQSGHLDCVKFFIQNGLNVNNVDKIRGWTPLIYAAQEGHLDCVKYLVENHADVNHLRTTALHQATFGGYFDVVKFLVENNADINQALANGLTPLHHAAQNGHTDCVKLLFDNNVNTVNHCTVETQSTALHLTASDGHLDCIKLLIKNKANVNQTNNKGRTALSNAAKGGHLGCAKYLLDKGADVNHRDNDGHTALLAAARGGSLDIFKLIISKIIPISLPFWQYVHITAIQGHVTVLLYLIETNGIVLNSEAYKHEIQDNTMDIGDSLKILEKNITTCRDILIELQNKSPYTVKLMEEIDKRINDIKRLQRRSNESKLFKMYSGNVDDDMISGIVISEKNVDVMRTIEPLDRILGKGSFGEVRLGIAQTGEGETQHFAVKCIDIQKHEGSLSLLDQETESLCTLRHKHIVSFYGHQIKYDMKEGKTMIHLVMELCREDLSSYYIKNGKANSANPAQASDFKRSLQIFLHHATQILSGMAYIHLSTQPPADSAKGGVARITRYVHKDIKLGNILLDFEKKAKICDFGLADILPMTWYELPVDFEKTTKFKGTQIYSAPEVLKDPNNRIYSPASDIFSLGLVLTEMYKGEHYYKASPFKEAETIDEKLNLLKSGVKPSIVDVREIENEVASIVDGCLKYDRLIRFSAEKAKEKFEKVLEKLYSQNPDLEPLFKEELKVPDVSQTVSDLLNRSQNSKDNVQPASTLFNFKSERPL